ncbi:hypothetical protein ACHAWO_011226 [Cyclotella atomus]|uniref:RING-CH-type domain-containing protein n=1 Tax=Cyclotella atomus TaxID=382360 RepID=A0ABD3PX79_9STRA
MNADNTDTENELLCWICYRDGPDEKGQQLLRGYCSCRGTSGCVHSSCAVENAQTRTKGIVERRGRIDRNALDKIWLHCPTCEQQWTGAMATSMGSACVEFIDKVFPHFKKLKILALGIKHHGYSFHGVSSEEHARVCDEVLSAIEEYVSTATVQGKEILLKLGYISDDILVLEVNALITESSVKLPGLDKKQHWQTSCSTTEYGGDDNRTLGRGFNLAETLIAMKQFDQAKTLLDSLYKSACRVHGPNQS